MEAGEVALMNAAKEHPIGKGLDMFHTVFNLICDKQSISCSVDALDHLDDQDIRSLTGLLLFSLQALPIANLLFSKTGRDSLRHDLLGLDLSTPIPEDFILSYIKPLFGAVLSNKPDNLIWGAVNDAVSEFPQPPLSCQTSFSTDSFSDSNFNVSTDIDLILKSEVQNIRIDHPDVFTTFFGPISPLAIAVFQSCKDSDQPLFKEDIGWLEWPRNHKGANVLGFFRRHMDQFLLLAGKHGFCPSKHRRYVITPDKHIPGSVSWKLNVGFAYDPKNGLEDSDRQSCDWSHILIPGALKMYHREDKHSSTWLDLLRYIREIFRAQDTRRFVLGFTLCGPTMRLWEFDRLGVVGSKPFNINKEGQMFVSVILGYLSMSDEELGFDLTILDDGKRYTQIQRGGRMECLGLEELIERKRSITGRATTCWRGSLGGEPSGGLVIKDSWEFEGLPEEGLLLKEATEAGVENIARYYHHETVHAGGEIDDVHYNVRKGLSDSGGKNPFQRQPALTEAATGGGKSGTITRKTSLSDVQTSMRPPKRPRLDSPVKQDAQQRHNRVHRRLIMQDIGKSIYEASSLRAILTALLGGIKGHESLLDAKILHRDISVGNIMLTMAEDDGFLIDLDLAIKLDRKGSSGASGKAGTKVFMAIGALYGEEHNFMHDLESFFWVLFWICIRWTGPGLRKSRTEYEYWKDEPIRRLAQLKSGMVLEEDKFTKEVIREFTVQCRPLIPHILGLRRVVFPNGRRWLSENRGLYIWMKSVLKHA